MTSLAVPEAKLYPVRKPVAAFLAGAAVAVLGGLIGLGGAEFRLPLLILVFSLFAHRAVRVNLLISLATLATASVVRLQYLQGTHVGAFMPEIFAMAAAGVFAAWVGAGQLVRIPKARIALLIGALLGVVAILLVLEALVLTPGAALLPGEPWLRVAAALVAGIAIGAVSSLLGVAGGEFIIPTLIFLFGADIKTAGTASVLISIPIVLTGVTRHWMSGHFRSKSLIRNLVIPMSLGSIAGAYVGGLLSGYAPTDALRLVLAGILGLSALKLWKESSAE